MLIKAAQFILWVLLFTTVIKFYFLLEPLAQIIHFLNFILWLWFFLTLIINLLPTLLLSHLIFYFIRFIYPTFASFLNYFLNYSCVVSNSLFETLRLRFLYSILYWFVPSFVISIKCCRILILNFNFYKIL